LRLQPQNGTLARRKEVPGRSLVGVVAVSHALLLGAQVGRVVLVDRRHEGQPTTDPDAEVGQASGLLGVVREQLDPRPRRGRGGSPRRRRSRGRRRGGRARGWRRRCPGPRPAARRPAACGRCRSPGPRARTGTRRRRCRPRRSSASPRAAAGRSRSAATRTRRR
jgi:hypothetical protein